MKTIALLVVLSMALCACQSGDTTSVNQAQPLEDSPASEWDPTTQALDEPPIDGKLPQALLPPMS